MKAMELENDPRLARILTTRGLLFGLQGAMTALFAFYIMVSNGLSLAPVFFPLYNALFLGTLILLIISAEGIFFFRLSTVYGKRSGAKFLIAKKAFRRSVALIAVAAAISAILVIFTFTPLANQSGSVSGQTGTVSFQSNNIFELNAVNSVSVTNLGINNLTFVVVSANDYNLAGAGAQPANESLLLPVSIAGTDNTVSAGGTTTVSVYTTTNTQYYLVIFPNTGAVRASYVLGMKAMPSLFYAMLISFAAIPVSGYLAAYSRMQMRELKPSTIFT